MEKKSTLRRGQQWADYCSWLNSFFNKCVVHNEWFYELKKMCKGKVIFMFRGTVVRVKVQVVRMIMMVYG